MAPRDGMVRAFRYGVLRTNGYVLSAGTDCVVVDPPEAIRNEVVLTQQKPEKVTITVTKLARKTLSEITLKWGGAVKEGYLMEAPVFDPMEISKFLYARSDNNGSYYSSAIRYYMELNVGIHNIFKIIRIDYVYRINYHDFPGVKKHGFRLCLEFDF